ncbi:hypothetical protein [Clostridium tetani]|uniref:hypothetical protein n=1 Tax=Clostridium tetani TaxID=1513 RepID=UPI0005130C87|nr:hypothetical protein [Clostridium tetani]KGI44860.1 hypothetical protein KY55_02555 [Clostridium tetani]RXI70706.1 hypothetical protein DP127_08740 [Clostridium tetani]BDR76115.1 hypothetical protein K154306013_17750 [Clostridium tetani]BDR87233.1 hypothetical protein N071400001_18410 [Clostridium tetani]
MKYYSQKELEDALKFISSTISKCEKMKLKFEEGTSQYSLLKHRIMALYISKDLIENDCDMGQYTQLDLEKALPPVVSIINKTEKARSKYIEGTAQYKRFTPIIRAMHIAKDFIQNEISK